MSTRSLIIRTMVCVACLLQGCIQHSPTEEHHLNLDGHAGQKRRGDDFSIPLCSWHHRGVPISPWPAAQCKVLFGPSLARSSKDFRQTYGSDDALLERTNLELERQVA